MAASAKVLTLDSRTCDGDWTVVLPRRGKHRRNYPKIRTPEEQQQPWFPSDIERDQVVESRLIQKLQTCIKKIECSQFYQTLMDQIQSPEIMDRICRVLGSEMNMKMVVYGIGSIEAYESPRFQLSIALLMKRKFSWIGDMEVFDPILSATELKVLEAFGCSVLSVNEQGRRHAVKPTLFYMPHCEANLYDNLLQVNWEMEQLNHIILFGNSFETYQQYVSEFTSSSVADSARHILAAQKFTDEFPVRIVSDDYYAAFHDSSLHFLSPVIETELLLI